MKLSDYVFDFLKRHGVDTVFLLPGGGCMHLVDSLSRSGISYTVCLHEQAAVVAADGYAQYTGKLGVALVTTGPGATNAITGVVGSFIDSVPVLIISGQVKRADMIRKQKATKAIDGRGSIISNIPPRDRLRQKGPQEVDIISLVKNVTKYSETIQEPRALPEKLSDAVRTAHTPREGPVWLDIPLDVQSAEITDYQGYEFNLPEGGAFEDDGFEEKYQRVKKAFLAAERPILLLGAGTDRETVGEEECGAEDGSTLRAIERLCVPVLTTWRAADLIPEDHPLFFGRPGTIAQRRANIIQQKSDFILCLGARLDLLQVGFNPDNFATNATKVIVDIDEAELEKYSWDRYIKINCDAAWFLSCLSRDVSSVMIPIDGTTVDFTVKQSSDSGKKLAALLNESDAAHEPLKITHVNGNIIAEGEEALVCRVPGSDDISIRCYNVTGNQFEIGKQIWVQECDRIKRDHPVFPKQYERTKDNYINPYQFIEELAKASSPDDVIVPASSGAAAEMMAQTWPIKKGQRFIFSPGLGSMGWGLPQAIGVALASRRRVICVIGDGDLQHNIQELQTLARLNLPVKLFVWNNGGYNSIRNSMTAHFGNPVCCGENDGLGELPPVSPDYCGDPSFSLAGVYGIRGAKMPIPTLCSHGGIEDIMEFAGPCLVEVMIDPDVPTEPRLKSKMVDGQMQTQPMEEIE